jgi:hypothetical protein
MAMVDRAVTVTTARMVSRSASLPRGRTEAMARAALAPQMPTAPPDSTPKLERRPMRLATNAPRPMVEPMPTMTMMIGVRPRPRIWLAVIRAPSRATPKRRMALDENSMPGDAAAFLVQEVEGHAEQQGEQHHRRAVVLGQPLRGQGDGHGHQHAGIELDQGRLAGEAGLGARCDGGLRPRQPFHALQRLEEGPRRGGVGVEIGVSNPGAEALDRRVAPAPWIETRCGRRVQAKNKPPAAGARGLAWRSRVGAGVKAPGRR